MSPKQIGLDALASPIICRSLLDHTLPGQADHTPTRCASGRGENARDWGQFARNGAAPRVQVTSSDLHHLGKRVGKWLSQEEILAIPLLGVMAVLLCRLDDLKAVGEVERDPAHSALCLLGWRCNYFPH